MGIPNVGWYGDADVGSAVQDIKVAIAKIETNKFTKKDLLKLYKANTELFKALLEDDHQN